ncbi:MAG: M42 family metallopeptidase [Planctomycetes bacterium]|nr:M42 family metallopeptidase [Planctomycetota bacterium]MBM4058754.1 M42 family metallopeptidase [Planctomycetota bacterium]
MAGPGSGPRVSRRLRGNGRHRLPRQRHRCRPPGSHTARHAGGPKLAASGRATPTDANVLQTPRAGVATALESIPNRSMHSAVETVSLDDLRPRIRCRGRRAAVTIRVTATRGRVNRCPPRMQIRAGSASLSTARLLSPARVSADQGVESAPEIGHLGGEDLLPGLGVPQFDAHHRPHDHHVVPRFHAEE